MKRIIVIIVFLLPFTACFSQTWENVGNGLTSGTSDLQKLHNKVYATGTVVAVWNDTSWVNLPYIVNASLYTLSVYNDTLYAGGGNSSFPTTYIYKYDGANWMQAGGDFEESDPSEDWCSTEQLLPFNGQLISGGHYSSINGTSISNIAAWNGNTWNALGNGLNNVVWNLAAYKGQLIASGDFTASGIDTAIRYIAKWDGSIWSPLDASFSFRRSLSQGPALIPMMSFDTLLIIGNVWDTINGTPMKGIAAWNGTAFTSMGSNLINKVWNFWVFNNELYVGAELNTLNPNAYEHVVLKWSGFYWQQVGGDFNGGVGTFEDFNNELYCGGGFTSPASYVSKLNTATSISELDKQMAFQFYPNPTTDKFILATDETGKLTITNQLGQFIDLITVKNHQSEISTSNLSPGIYFLTFQTEKYSVTKKLIIQK